MCSAPIPPSETTPEHVYLSRRRFIAGSAALTLGGVGAHALSEDWLAARGFRPGTPIEGEEATPIEYATAYNNFYEFGTDKDGVWRNVGPFEARPWELEVTGLVENPGVYDLVELERAFPLEERIYRHRCVERWSVVVPWIGFPLARLLERVQPRNEARYVGFVTFNRPEQAFGQKTQTWYKWPYYEGLRMDEAMNELAFVATGMYGHPLQKQNGAPVRIHLPWKYGYKSPKSIVRIDVTDEMPTTFWNDLQPSEYGFYSNVDPDVPHPRWSQAQEEIVGTGQRVPTLQFNGYGEWVGELYGGRVTPVGDVPHSR